MLLYVSLSEGAQGEQIDWLSLGAYEFWEANNKVFVAVQGVALRFLKSITCFCAMKVNDHPPQFYNRIRDYFYLIMIIVSWILLIEVRLLHVLFGRSHYLIS